MNMKFLSVVILLPDIYQVPVAKDPHNFTILSVPPIFTILDLTKTYRRISPLNVVT